MGGRVSVCCPGICELRALGVVDIVLVNMVEAPHAAVLAVLVLNDHRHGG